MRHKRRDWLEKFMWLKLTVGLFFAISFSIMMVWSSVTAPTMEEAVQNMVKFGVLAGVSFTVATVPTCGGCLG